MHSAEYWVQHLDLQPHPEGGYYRSTYRSEELIPAEGLPPRFEGPRLFGTGIYFLIRSDNFSAFHRLKADELWHHYTGTAITLHFIDRQGSYWQQHLGPDPTSGQAFQVLAPAGCWFAAEVEVPDTFALAGCTMAPGFDFADFELARREELQALFPQHKELVGRLTRG